MYNKEALKFESTMVIGFALLSIEQKGSSVTELGPKMGMEPTSLSRLVNTMEERKLIKRSKNPNDGIILKQIQEAAINNQNIFKVMMEATKVCSLGEITNALFEVGGQYRRNM